MTQMLALADLEGKSEADVKEHLIDDFSGQAVGLDWDYSEDYQPTEADKQKVREQLEPLEVLVAYEHCGWAGCGSSAWFLLRDKASGNLFEVSGGHDSVSGFGGQFSLEPTFFDYLLSDKFSLSTGDYDEDARSHEEVVKKHLSKLRPDLP